MDQSIIKKVRLFQLQKQHFLHKSSIKDYLTIVKENIGLHSTDYLTPYLSLWARVENFDPQLLFDDLNKHREAVRLRAFRGTIFVVHRDNLERAPVLSQARVLPVRADCADIRRHLWPLSPLHYRRLGGTCYRLPENLPDIAPPDTLTVSHRRNHCGAAYLRGSNPCHRGT